MVRYLLTSILLLSSTGLAQSSANWKRHVSIDRASGERTTTVNTTSTNLVTFFGRKGRGELEVQTYQGLVGLVVRTFAKTPEERFPIVTMWLDDEKLKEGVWSRSETSSATLVRLTFREELPRMLEAKILTVEFKGTDDEIHKLTFNIQGLRAHLNFLEVKLKK
jgi:hypothetical protein